jgi:hypothetical protein
MEPPYFDFDAAPTNAKTAPRYTLFDEDNDPLFSCSLKCVRCQGGTRGRQCKRTVCIGLPVCWQHARTYYNIRIKDSNIQGAGKGVFVDRPRTAQGVLVFKKKDKICPYYGDVLNEDEYNARARNPIYTLRLRGGENPLYEDAACERGIGSIINHTTTRNSNVRFSIGNNPKKGWIVATKNIYNGDELLVNYGSDYVLGADAFETRRKKWSPDYFGFE